MTDGASPQSGVLRRPTLLDVAERAGVSTATVSRCVSAADCVRPATRERVQAAIDALGYTPHFGGRALASNRTNTIGAVIPTMDNAIFARALQAMEETLAEAGVTLLVASSNYDATKEQAQLRAMLERGVDGLLLIGHARPDDAYALLRRRATPFVLAWTLDAEKADATAAIGFDNRRAAQAIADQVLDAGHCEIGMIAGETLWNDRAEARIVGVRDALGARGLRLAAPALIEAPYTIDAGAASFSRLMRLAPRPTAVICGNDVLAAGAAVGARAAGLSIPGDVSITGFDNLDLAEVVPPGITTVHVPHRRMGRRAAETLLALRNGDDLPPADAFDTWIVERGSLAPPPR